MKGRDINPLVMWFCLVTGIVVLAFIRPSRVPNVWFGFAINFDNIFISSYILWMLAELHVSHKDVSTAGKKISDAATCQLYGFGQAMTFFTALWFPSVWKAPNIAHCLGMVVFFSGVCYRLWAIRTLGQYYSHRVQTASQHRIVTSGPYRFTRHPAYAGMIVANIGISIYFLNWVTLCVFLFILVPAILIRIKIEERALSGITEYAEFARKRKRFIPGVW